VTDHLFHIVARSTWATALMIGEYRPPSLADEGYVHFSFADQVTRSVRVHFAGQSGLCVLEVDPGRLPGPVVVEDTHGAGTAFPHLYAAVPLDAVVALREVDDPLFSAGAGGAAAPASTDR